MTTAATYRTGSRTSSGASAICRVEERPGASTTRLEIADLVGAASFEDATRLLWFGELPSGGRAHGVARASRRRGPCRRPCWTCCAGSAECHPWSLRTAVSLAAASDRRPFDEPAANLRKAYQ